MTRARDLADFNLDGKAVTINESSADLDFRVESNGNANMLFVDAGNDKVGIGTSSPTQTLSIGGAASGTVALQVTNSTAGTAFNDGMQMFINDSAGGFNMRENYPLQLYVNGSERMRVASDGKVGINTTAPNLQTSINFDSSAVAGVGIHDTNSGNLGGMLQFYSGSGQGTLRANIMNANNAGVHMAVGTGGSVVFTQNSYVAANALDDYEEGTFVPTYSGLTISSVSSNNGKYIKIGDMVMVQVDLQDVTWSSGGGHLGISNLPFSGAAQRAFTGTFAWYYLVSNLGTADALAGYIAGGTSSMNLYASQNNHIWHTIATPSSGSNGYFNGTFMYST